MGGAKEERKEAKEAIKEIVPDHKKLDQILKPNGAGRMGEVKLENGPGSEQEEKNQALKHPKEVTTEGKVVDKIQNYQQEKAKAKGKAIEGEKSKTTGAGAPASATPVPKLKK